MSEHMNPDLSNKTQRGLLCKRTVPVMTLVSLYLPCDAQVIEVEMDAEERAVRLDYFLPELEKNPVGEAEVPDDPIPYESWLKNIEAKKIEKTPEDGRQKKCWHCDGTGRMWSALSEGGRPCEKCDGLGEEK